MKPLFLLAFCVASVVTAVPVSAQQARWALTAINGTPVDSDGHPFEIVFKNKDSGGFQCGWSSGDFAIASDHIVFREVLRVTSAEPAGANARYANAHSRHRCDRALHLTTVVVRNDEIVLSGETLGTTATDTFTFSPIPTTSGNTQ